MGIHGNMLPFFCDEFHTFLYFNMQPRVTTGFEGRTGTKKIRGVIHMFSVPPSAEGTAVRQSHENSVIEKSPFFWTRWDLQIGWFVQELNRYDLLGRTDVYRLSSLNEWIREGTMKVFGLEKVVGDDGTITNNPTFNLGGDSFS